MSTIDLSNLQLWQEEAIHALSPLALAERIIPQFEQINTGTVVAEITADSFTNRAERLAAYIGEAGIKNNRAALRTAFLSLTEEVDGGLVDIGDYAGRVRELYSAVFTGHPVYGMTPGLSKKFSQYFSAIAGGQTADSLTGLHAEIMDEYRKGFTPLSLDEEEEETLGAIANLHEALQIAKVVAMEVAQEKYPDSWTSVNYCPGHIGTWIPFDWDGRKDVQWYHLMEKRINLQIKMLERYETSFGELEAALSGDTGNQARVRELQRRIMDTRGKMECQRDLYREYDPDNDPENAKLIAMSNALSDPEDTRIKDPAELSAPLDEILAGQDDLEIQKLIVSLRSDLDIHGLSFAQAYFRINSTSVLTAMAETGTPGLNLRGTGADLDQAAQKVISGLLADVKAQQSNLGDAACAQQSIMKQMIIIRQIFDDIDPVSPIRYLIAEANSASVVLSALYFAKKLGIDDNIDISPLFEDRDGSDNARRVVRGLLQDSTYAAYIKKRGRFCIQLGYSDSGRFDGQLSGASFMEKVKGETLMALRDAGLQDDVKIFFFDTHGDSIGRGRHPKTATDSLAYIFTPFLSALADKHGIHMRCEESFQGGDGNLFYSSPNVALAMYARAAQHMVTYDADALADPYYRPEESGGYREEALMFYNTVRDAHSAIVQDQGYVDLIAVYLGINEKTGSRPVKRTEEARSLPRAIQHNGTLMQLGIFGNVFYGLGKAIQSDPDKFHEMCKKSSAFNRRISMMIEAMRQSNPHIMRGYVELFNPNYWHQQAHQKTNDEKVLYKRIAAQLEKMDVYQNMSRVVREIIDDYELANEYLDIPSLEPKQEMNMGVLHGLRQAEIVAHFKDAVQIPEISPRHDMSRNELVHRLMSFDITAIDDLREIFAANDGAAHLPSCMAKTSTLAREGTGYGHVNQQIIDPLEAHFGQIKSISSTLSNYRLAVG